MYLARAARTRPAALAPVAGAVLTLSMTPHAHAQLAIPSSTVDCGGGTSTGGVFAVSGTIGQADAGPGTTGASSGSITIIGGFWGGTPRCPADFNNSGVVNVQDIFDFLSAWFAADPRADFNGVNRITVQDIFDFLAAWFAGCS